jgi:hypothetical protein
MRKHPLSKSGGSLLLGCILAVVLAACGASSSNEQASVDAGQGAGRTSSDGAGAVPDDPPQYNNHNISRDHYVVGPAFISEGVLRPGDGLDMSSPDVPQRRVGRRPLNIKVPMQASAAKPYTLTENFRLVEAESTAQEASLLTGYFQGSYRFASAEAAYEQARQERQSSHSIYAILDATGTVHDVTEFLVGEDLQWRAESKPVYEGSDVGDADFRRQFLQDYGSHYVSAITYGYRIAVRGKISQSESQNMSKIKAAFKAAFVAGGAQGGISKEDKALLSGSKLELIFSATSGGLYTDGEQRPGVLTNLDDILAMLKDLRSGKTKIHSAPMQATARTYWNLLPPEFTRSRMLLADHGAPPLPEPFYGVPKGTVIPWRPTEKNLRTDNAQNTYLVAPEGWALCDGENGTPDLRNRFVLGSVAYAELGAAGGAESHAHTASTKKSTAKWDQHGGMGSGYKQTTDAHTHEVTVAGAKHMPPFVKLAYIMKL